MKQLMTTSQPESRLPTEDREALRQAVLRTAEASRAPEGFDLERIVREADEAFWVAKTQVKVSGEPVAANENEATVANRDLAVSKLMASTAVHNLRADRERGILYDVVSGAIVPALVGGIAFVLARQVDVLYAKYWLGMACIVFGSCILWSLRDVLRQKPTKYAAHPGHVRIEAMIAPAMTRYAAQSTGAMVVGLAASILVGLYVIEDATKRTEASLVKVNESAAISIAAARDSLSVGAAQTLVGSLTGADWIRMEEVKGSTNSQPTLVAKAVLPAGRALALVERVARLQTATERPMDSYSLVLKTASGSSKYADYIVGKVVSSNAAQVTLELDSGETRTIDLPAGTLPPAPSAEVVAAISTKTGKASFVQSIDGVLAKLGSCRQVNGSWSCD